jgi:hypothetical protein
MLQGGCLCGAVRYQYHGALGEVMACHCLECRQAQGTPFVTNMPIDATQFELVSGADALKSYESSAGKHRVFCGHCGSPIYSRLDSLPNVMRLRLGSVKRHCPSKALIPIFLWKIKPIGGRSMTPRRNMRVGKFNLTLALFCAERALDKAVV